MYGWGRALKRKLRKLEQEIQTLREELEKTQARGVELEQQAKVATNAVAAQKRKEEREARLQALKERSTSQAASDSACGTGGLGGRERNSGLCETADSGEDDSTS